MQLLTLGSLTAIGLMTILVVTISTTTLSSKDLVRSTNYGLVRGFEAKTVDKETPYLRFTGIPYAQPPIGDLRFKPPQAPKKWLDIMNATYDRNICTQTSNVSTVVGSEDCLYINVYVPEINHTKSFLPVMVWIYGGGFNSGDSQYGTYGPDFFLDDNVLFVSFNYRVGVFGFLSTQDNAAPGNVGIKDQIFALRWVHENIEAFGGNPKDVTIFGQSAGAASISYLLLVTSTKGLYQRAILQSGNAICHWAQSLWAKQVAFNIGKQFEITTSDSNILVDELRKINYEKLQEVSTKIATLSNPYDLVFGPVIEPDHAGAVFSSPSYHLFEKGNFNRVPLLMGLTSEEGNWFVYLLEQYKNFLGSLDESSSHLVPTSMNIKNHAKAERIGNLIRRHYFNETDNLAYLPTIHFTSDDQFVRSICQLVRLVVKFVPTYLYQFSYIGETGDPNRGNKTGAGHCEELNYQFRINYVPDHINKKDTTTRHRLNKLWTNFAKTGNPTPNRDQLLQNVKWPTSTVNNLTYLDIGDDLTVQSYPHKYDMDFWDALYEKYANSPYTTY